MNRIIKFCVQCLLVLSLGIVGQLDAQDLGGLPGGGGVPIDNDALTNEIFDAVDAGGGTGTGTGGGGGGGNGNVNDPVDNTAFDIELEIEPDVRNERGFVGVSLADPDTVINQDGFRFVGPRAEGTDAGGAGRGAGGNAERGGGGGAINVRDGIFVERRNAVRTRLVPRFQAPVVSPNFVSTRFNQRIRSLPATRNVRNSLSVVMQGRTAVIRGSALNREQINNIARQLRLEPGVSRIVSQVSINP